MTVTGAMLRVLLIAVGVTAGLGVLRHRPWRAGAGESARTGIGRQALRVGFLPVT